MAIGRKRLALEVAALLVVVALIVTFVARRRNDSDRHVDHRFMMGTIVSVTVLTPDADAGRAAIDAAFDEIARIEALITRHSEDSEIARLNARAEGFVGESVSREVAQIVWRSLAVARASCGAFDITVTPLVDLWTLNDEDFSVPDESAVSAALRSVDWRAVQVDTATCTMTVLPGTTLDLDGVAKGYAVDRAVAVLEAMGMKTGVVDAGGDVGFAGRPPDGDGWRVGIKHPRQDGLLGVANLSGGGIATSGDYQRYALVDGVRYHHILDPATGYPARGVMSVTVASERAVDADALATAVFVLGPDEGLALIERTPGAAAVVVTGDGDSVGRVLVSSGLKEKFVEQ
ncbi:MAG: FAD:protein FMN transferase [Candidatus Eisenbacteria sp.]|nr:FAD:protein FMN transferase [Candidatus Eisenbacteria bacterium]